MTDRWGDETDWRPSINLPPHLDRYWGESSPYQILDTKNLTYLTLENAVADLVHFARTVRLPFDPTGASNADKAVSSLSCNQTRSNPLGYFFF